VSISVLIVDDLPEFRQVFGDMIAATSDMVLAGSSGTLAGGLALLDQGPVDILLVDLGLPDGSGLTLIREAVKRWPGRCDVMVISVFADEHHVLAAIEAGATGYLLKDASPIDVVQQIRELRAGGSPISPIIARQLLFRLAPPASSVSPPLETVTLTEQERSVLCYAAKGFTFDEVAGLLNISRHTVMTYVKRSYQKLQVHSKTEALHEARRMGLLLD
jgi:DNA-binding NarL/FixJ family response regulator